jgi:hypothetical protein
MRPPSCCPWLVASCLFLASGCKEPMNSNVGRPGAPTAESAPSPPPPPAEPEKVSHGEILGRRTQDIRPAAPELEKGAVVAGTAITARDPITLQGNAYVTMIGRTSILQIEHALNLYKATNDRYPANFEEFQNEIIKANNIALPVLPHYQEYGYDEKEHKLVILEYPDRKARANRGGN